MTTTRSAQSGHFHLIAAGIVVVVLIGAMGAFVYYRNYRPSKVTDPTVRAELQKASSDLKSVDLASVKASVASVQSTQKQFKK